MDLMTAELVLLTAYGATAGGAEGELSERPQEPVVFAG